MSEISINVFPHQEMALLCQKKHYCVEPNPKEIETFCVRLYLDIFYGKPYQIKPIIFSLSATNKHLENVCTGIVQV